MPNSTMSCADAALTVAVASGCAAAVARIGADDAARLVNTPAAQSAAAVILLIRM